MAFDPTKDFLALWRNTAGVLSKLEMPGLDFVVAALARAGLLTVAVSATAPVANQSTTAWLQTAVPSTSAEGQLFLWDPVATAYAAATPKLLLLMLEASAGQSGVSWWTSTGGAPANTVGNNGDFAIRTDQPGGIYGPKAAGAWPANPLPGTTTGFASTDLDSAFGPQEGNILYRGPLVWQALAIGAANSVMVSNGTLPLWEGLSALIDAACGNVRGDVLYRGVAGWAALSPSTAGFALKTNGPGADPAWAAPEFPTGTSMLFCQAAAPTGWTKRVDTNDIGLRVTSGTGGVFTPGTTFTTVFSQTQVGGHALTVSEIPAHTHKYNQWQAGPQQSNNVGAGYFPGTTNTPPLADTDGGTGGGGTHTHTVALNLAYIDVIIATKN